MYEGINAPHSHCVYIVFTLCNGLQLQLFFGFCTLNTSLKSFASDVVGIVFFLFHWHSDTLCKQYWMQIWLYDWRTLFVNQLLSFVRDYIVCTKGIMCGKQSCSYIPCHPIEHWNGPSLDLQVILLLNIIFQEACSSSMGWGRWVLVCILNRLNSKFKLWTLLKCAILFPSHITTML